MVTLVNIQSFFRLSPRLKDSIILIICLGGVFLFLTSAYTKIVDHERFILGLAKVTFVGSLATFVGWMVPISEIAIALLLIIPKTQRAGLYAFTGLMGVFTLYIVSMYFWAEKLPCQCNLIIERLGWGEHLVFNSACIALAVIALRLSKLTFKNNKK